MKNIYTLNSNTQKNFTLIMIFLGAVIYSTGMIFIFSHSINYLIVLLVCFLGVVGLIQLIKHKVRLIGLDDMYLYIKYNNETLIQLNDIKSVSVENNVLTIIYIADSKEEKYQIPAKAFFKNDIIDVNNSINKAIKK